RNSLENWREAMRLIREPAKAIVRAQASSPPRRVPAARYTGLSPASALASRIASAASRKSGTSPELLLVHALRQLGLKPSLNVADLPGHPDIVFRAAKVAVFCDGDFWHGRNFAERRRKLCRGHNAQYWVA